ncbi:nucleolar protein 5A [Naegleria gruberi]|uniref:Nucleolar protein 56 n=1 Tax=Naegleria gruberi TaxID=5762 RepID=D2VNT4_NAEGR|nr:nucleolar protein 5A [Naegleria gruberi]EFC41469.1 nucleolar protein 5A [Naegleria gruberi]|eukprot:XP_002674213.1 nucleolar protein 5A [Naegleria gruberi strain NEG-M]
MPSYILFESALGFAIFEKKKVDEVAYSKIEKQVGEYSRFKDMVKFIAFQPFDTPEHGLENMNAISEGILTEFLQNFLEANLKAKNDTQLGVLENKLGGAIQEHFEKKITCFTDDSVLGLCRGIRMHIHKFIDNLKKGDLEKAQLGLGHAYSRAKVKFNVNKSDNNIIQSISMLDQLDKDLNTFTMRLKEWYGWHFPELVKIVKKNDAYAKCALAIKTRSSLSKDSEKYDELVHQLNDITKDEEVTEQVVRAARSSMGQDASEFDMMNMELFAKKVVDLTEYRAQLFEYLETKMHDVAPNLTCILGESVGARLISKAGSLMNLCKCPASTVQILGAEKALFRALKTRGKTPKYGLLYHSSFVSKASKQNKGKIARYLSNKCAMAARIDAFQDFPTSKFGELLRDQIAERLEFYEKKASSGNAKITVKLKKNIELMRDAIKHAKKDEKEAPKKEKKPAEKRKRDAVETPVEEEKKSKKEKKDKKKDKKDKKEKKSKKEEEVMEDEKPAEEEKKSKKEKKDKKKSKKEEEVEEPVAEESKKDKKKKDKKEKKEKKEESVKEEKEEKKEKKEKKDKKKDKKKH